MEPDDPRHGQERGYFAHRKAAQSPCEDCLRAHRAAEKVRQMRRMRGIPAKQPIIGIRRRIQALARLGWSVERIAIAADVDRHTVSRAKWETYGDFINADVAAKIAGAYERLAMTLPEASTWQQRGIITRTRTCAERHDWPPPLAWDDIETDLAPKGMRAKSAPYDDVDPVVVDRILAGAWGMQANLAERSEVCRRWAAQGVSTYEMARRTGWKVERYWRGEQEAS